MTLVQRHAFVPIDQICHDFLLEAALVSSLGKEDDTIRWEHTR